MQIHLELKYQHELFFNMYMIYFFTLKDTFFHKMYFEFKINNLYLRHK